MEIRRILIAMAVAAMIAVPMGAFSKNVSAEESSEGERYILGEYFGADWCGYCPRGAKANEDLANAYSDYIFIKYDADETINVNVAGAAPVERGTYYAVNFVPDTIVDGKSDVYPDAAFTLEQRYTTAKTLPSFGTISLAGSTIDVSGGYENAKMIVKIKVDAALPIAGPDVALFVAPIESNVYIWQEDWEHVYSSDDASVSQWYHLVRQLNQYAFAPLPSGSFEVAYEYALKDIKSRQVADEGNNITAKTAEELANTLGVTVFIQDTASRTIYAAAQIPYLIGSHAALNGTASGQNNTVGQNVTGSQSASGNGTTKNSGSKGATPGFEAIAGVAAVSLALMGVERRRKR
ncbi:MAG: thioredoxin family protein [Candidatus Thermoplasmatota archaeon]|nr:thioredoxin family protein [Candidatus Thermoplasmatota archaeon]